VTESLSFGGKISQEFSREFGTEFGLNVRRKNKDFWFNINAGINNYGHKSLCTYIGYKGIYIFEEYYQHFDYTNFDRKVIGIGIKINF
jgi:hypothetical protein